jgi:hypothetical protein
MYYSKTKTPSLLASIASMRLFSLTLLILITTKSKLAHQLEAEATSIPLFGPFDKSSSVLIRDGMALIQSLNVQRLKTFGDLASYFTQSQLSCFPAPATYIDSFGANLLGWDPSWYLTINSPNIFKRTCLLESTVMNFFQSGILRSSIT